MGEFMSSSDHKLRRLELLLRVGAYGAVGVFLLAAGYLYRESGEARRSTA